MLSSNECINKKNNNKKKSSTPLKKNAIMTDEEFLWKLHQIVINLNERITALQMELNLRENQFKRHATDKFAYEENPPIQELDANELAWLHDWKTVRCSKKFRSEEEKESKLELDFFEAFPNRPIRIGSFLLEKVNETRFTDDDFCDDKEEEEE